MAAKDTGVKHNLDGHLRGGISNEEIDAFAAEWQSFPEMKERLFRELRQGFSALKVSPADVAPMLEASESAAKIREELAESFGKWKDLARSYITQDIGRKPKATIELLGTAMLTDSGFVSAVIDPYDVYGALMDYINETMRDDLYILNSDGWLAGREIVVARQTRNAKEWDGLLVPKAVVANRFFPDLVEKARVAAEKAEAAEAAYDCFIAEETDKGQDSDILEQNGDEWKVVSDKELKKLASQSDAAKNCLALKKAKTDAAAAEKSASKALDEATEKKYPLLTEEEIQSMLFDDKWFAALRTSVLSIFDASLRKFATALATLAERYAHSLGELEANLAASQDEVHAVLREMGFNW